MKSGQSSSSHSTCPALTKSTHHLEKEATWTLRLWTVPSTKVCPNPQMHVSTNRKESLL